MFHVKHMGKAAKCIEMFHVKRVGMHRSKSLCELNKNVKVSRETFVDKKVLRHLISI